MDTSLNTLCCENIKFIKYKILFIEEPDKQVPCDRVETELLVLVKIIKRFI